MENLSRAQQYLVKKMKEGSVLIFKNQSKFVLETGKTSEEIKPKHVDKLVKDGILNRQVTGKDIIYSLVKNAA